MEAFQSLCQIGSSINQETAVKAHRRTERRGELLVKTTNSRDCRGVGFRLLNPVEPYFFHRFGERKNGKPLRFIPVSLCVSAVLGCRF
jgi:hypothetical protein